MNPMKWKKVLGLVLAFMIFMFSATPAFRCFASFPHEINLFTGEQKQLEMAIPVDAVVSNSNPDILSINGQREPSSHISLNRPISLQSSKTGQSDLHIKLFGLPVEHVHVNVIPGIKVIPGGQTIGVKLKSKGILVVGHHLVTVKGDKKISPGENADIRMGDLILKMNDKRIDDVKNVSEIVRTAGESGRSLHMTVLRSGHRLHLTLKPAFDVVDQAYRLGLYIRDSAAGVGTLTFYAPKQHVYGALGHIITDMDTRTPIQVGSGQILYSNVTSIAKSENGEPGEKRANFYQEDKILGNIQQNSPYGIFGMMKQVPDHGIVQKAIPVAFAADVHEGPAQIYTVINGQKVEKFDIEIVHVTHQNEPKTKGMIIRITDPKLLQKTGGIVQGMSGSPIIQEGRLVGAVTHVFVNDPTSGYGCYAEWMLREAGMLKDKQENNQKAS